MDAGTTSTDWRYRRKYNMCSLRISNIIALFRNIDRKIVSNTDDLLEIEPIAVRVVDILFPIVVFAVCLELT